MDTFTDALAYDFPEALALTDKEATNPTAYGKPVKRRVLQLGERYFWKDVCNNQELFHFWRVYLDIPEHYNSLLVNIYQPGESINWHTDKTNKLARGSMVISVSVCPFGTDEKLGVMKFRTAGGETKEHELRHLTRIEFDPFTHARDRVQHTARSTRPRYNFTFRVMN